MDIITRGTCLVLTDPQSAEVIQFFFATHDFDIDACTLSGCSPRRLSPGLVGFNMRDKSKFSLNNWWVNRVATREERERCLQWMRDNGIYFNQNTLKIIENE